MIIRTLFQDEFDPGYRIQGSPRLVDQNPIYTSTQYNPTLPSDPGSRSLSSLYGTLPRQALPQHSYTYHEHLSRQRSISHLGKKSLRIYFENNFPPSNIFVISRCQLVRLRIMIAWFGYDRIITSNKRLVFLGKIDIL